MFDTSIPVGFIVFMLVFIVLAIALIIFGGKSQRAQKQAASRWARKLYQFLSTNFLTSEKMLKIVDRLSALSIYSRQEITQIATKYYLIATGISAAIIIAGFVLFNDTVSIMICVAFGLVVNNVMIDKQLNKTNVKIYNNLKAAVSSIRQEYLRLESIPEAIAEADIPALLRKPFDEIYQIMTSADGEMRLLKFYESTPFRSIQTLAGICYNINNSGDEKDLLGQSNFVQALTMLTSDINQEVERLAYLKKKFGVIEYLSLIPLFLINIIENFFVGAMPGVVLIYQGMIGYICRIVTLLLCCVCYSMVCKINSPNSIKYDDRAPWTISVLKNKTIRQIVCDLEPKDKKRRILEYKLSKANSKKGPEHVTVERIAFAFAGLIASIIIASTVVTMARDYYENSTDQLSLVADESMDGYEKEDILALDRVYMEKLAEYGGTIGDEEAQSLIKGAMPSLSDLQIQDQQARILHKYESLQRAYFHWYYLLVCILLSLACWFIPSFSIWFRALMVSTEAEDDFLQLQTLMAILMNMNIDTLEAIYQLSQNSRIFKDELLYCYHSYPSNPVLELARLKNKIRIPDFKRFVDKLQLTVSELSLADAYSDLYIERDHMLHMREMNMYATIDRKRAICSPIAMAPFIMMVIGEFVIPIGYLGITEFSKALGSMG